MADFDTEYEALFGYAFASAYRILANRHDAADAAQEAMVRAFLKWSKIEGYARPWVCRTAVNLALDQVRRASRRSGDPAPSDLPTEELDENVDLVRAITALPKRQREVIFLRYFAGLSEQEIATAIGRAPGTVKSHAARGLEALGQALREDERCR